jgi:hypothetical protein
MHESLP